MNIKESIKYIRNIIGDIKCNTGIVLGSGLHNILNNYKIYKLINYSDIPYLNNCSIKGHKSKMIFLKSENNYICVLSGRLHFYENLTMKEVTYPIRILNSLGVKNIIMTNSSGGINKNYEIGDIIIVNDHINFPGLCGNNPLIGLNKTIEFLPTNNIYNNFLLEKATKFIENEKIQKVKYGTYCFVSGPTYESSAEIRMLNILGGDLVGMSTIPEVIIAHSLNMNILVLACITNKCIHNHLDKKIPTHNEVVENSKKGISKIINIINNVIE